MSDRDRDVRVIRNLLAVIVIVGGLLLAAWGLAG